MVFVKSLIDMPVEYIKAMSPQQIQLFNESYRLNKQKFKCDIVHFNPVFCTQYPFAGLMCNRVNRWGNAQVTFACMKFIICAIDHESNGSPVLWAYTLVDIFYQKNEEMVTLNDLVTYFPFGLPTPEGVRYMWDKQQTEGGDLLDDKINWKSNTIAFHPLELRDAEMTNLEISGE